MKVKATVVKPVKEVLEDEFDLMDRKELSAYAKVNRTGVPVMPSLTVNDIRNFLREWKEEESLLNEERYLKSVSAVQVKIPSLVKPLASKERLTELREKRATLMVTVTAPVSTSKPKAAINPLEEKLALLIKRIERRKGLPW